MKSLLSKIKNFKLNNKGQGATEYILLLAIVVGLVFAFKSKIKNKLDSTTDAVGTQIDQVTAP